MNKDQVMTLIDKALAEFVGKAIALDTQFMPEREAFLDLVRSKIAEGERDESRDWKEDKDEENGNYMNICVLCSFQFIGRKGRVVCKVCNEH